MNRILLGLLVSIAAVAQAARKALVGGVLIDGYGGPPIRNSVILIGRADSGRRPGGNAADSAGRRSHLDRWDERAARAVGHARPHHVDGHSDYAHWDKTYPSQLESVIMPASAKQLLMAGVTSARDLGAPLEASIHVRDAIRSGKIPGATLYVSGPFLQHEPYPGTEYFRWGVKDAADARAKVQKLAEAGVDCIKLIDQDQMTHGGSRGHRR